MKFNHANYSHMSRAEALEVYDMEKKIFKALFFALWIAAWAAVGYYAGIAQ